MASPAPITSLAPIASPVPAASGQHHLRCRRHRSRRSHRPLQRRPRAARLVRRRAPSRRRRPASPPFPGLAPSSSPPHPARTAATSNQRIRMEPVYAERLAVTTSKKAMASAKGAPSSVHVECALMTDAFRSRRPRFSVFIAVSVDGYIARLDGSIDWLAAVEQKGEDYGYKQFFDAVDALVLGRKTYEVALGFDPWPYAGKRCIVLTPPTCRFAPRRGVFRRRDRALVDRSSGRRATRVRGRRHRDPGNFSPRSSSTISRCRSFPSSWGEGFRSLPPEYRSRSWSSTRPDRGPLGSPSFGTARANLLLVCKIP